MSGARGAQSYSTLYCEDDTLLVQLVLFFLRIMRTRTTMLRAFCTRQQETPPLVSKASTMSMGPSWNLPPAKGSQTVTSPSTRRIRREKDGMALQLVPAFYCRFLKGSIHACGGAQSQWQRSKPRVEIILPFSLFQYTVVRTIDNISSRRILYKSKTCRRKVPASTIFDITMKTNVCRKIKCGREGKSKSKIDSAGGYCGPLMLPLLDQRDRRVVSRPSETKRGNSGFKSIIVVGFGVVVVLLLAADAVSLSP